GSVHHRTVVRERREQRAGPGVAQLRVSRSLAFLPAGNHHALAVRAERGMIHPPLILLVTFGWEPPKLLAGRDFPDAGTVFAGRYREQAIRARLGVDKPLVDQKPGQPGQLSQPCTHALVIERSLRFALVVSLECFREP